jgi:hypothetical protein
MKLQPVNLADEPDAIGKGRGPRWFASLDIETIHGRNGMHDAVGLAYPPPSVIQYLYREEFGHHKLTVLILKTVGEHCIVGKIWVHPEAGLGRKVFGARHAATNVSPVFHVF